MLDDVQFRFSSGNALGGGDVDYHVQAPPASGRGPFGHVWRPPDGGAFKVNTDVALNVLNGKVGTGAVIRDSLGAGAVLASCAQVVSASYDPLTAEVLAVLNGLIFAKDSGLCPCVLETDAQ
ncbi:hypothetical protein Q3G72_033892 [Acer saccharum]|nr:hypothetical protein Q3G72_033892 [Acer saccharum]